MNSFPLDISSYMGLPELASAHGYELDYWTGLVHWLMLILFVGWGVYFIYVLFRFRKSRQPQASYVGAKGTISKLSEGGVVVAEVMLLVVFAIPTWAVLKNDFPATEEGPVVVHAVAEQFAWNLHYPGADGLFGRRSVDLVDTQLNPLGLDRDDPAGQDDIVTLNELHLPVNRPVIVHITSKDVIHSFSLPQMRVKQDAIPGLDIPVWFMPTKVGDYEIACAQLCGLSHYRMRGYVTIHEPADFDAWLAEMAP